MTVSAGASEATAGKFAERRALGVGCGAHALHDGYTDLVYVMLPIWQHEFALGYAALGLMRTVFSGTLAGFQIPMGFLAERFGTGTVLALGTALAGIGYVLAGFSVGVAMLVAALFVGGLGCSTQHPLASSLIAQAFAGPRSLKALGTYNFAGDLGKMTLPALGSLLFVVLPWRHALMLLGGVGVVAALVIFAAMPRFAAEAPAPAKKESIANGGGRLRTYGFPLLLSVGVLDSATRMAFLTFLPFVLTAKGASLPTIGASLTLVFAGGAAGKLVCAFIGARIGAVPTVWLTEAVTALGIITLLPLPLEAALFLLPVIGVALNGTSSVLYGSVPELVTPEKRQRAFGIFYTGTIGAGAISPALYGLLGDAVGVPNALIVVGSAVLLTLPITLALRPALANAAAP
jgi:FSR family fosmidomycin resistance protein-like MFS transporter